MQGATRFKSFRGSLPLVLVTLACLAIGLWAYPRLPDKVPTHWNWRGEIDGWSGKTFAVFFLPALILALIGLFGLLPALDPFKQNYERFAGAYSVIRAVIVLFFNAVYLVSILAGLGYLIDTSLVVRLGISLMFIALGDQMGRLKQNWFIGIRVPWTLASEENWRRTHRWGGRTIVLGGALSLLALPFNTPVAAAIHFGLVIGGIVAPVVYSYVLFRQGVR
ncbi:MAG: DUF1648 domain-containing protein [Firmicutes bacterium]|nr:DUF1648 domain-containing protein [Bacillota bacterium]